MASSILSPVTKVPYDVLAEIFIHCLPQYRLKHRQPDTTIAPMLLCHICSSWRMITLTSTALWSHLSYRLVVAAQSNDFFKANWVVSKNQYAFLLWWKKNQGSMAPSLCLYLDWQEDQGLKHESALELDEVGMITLFTYISSAQFIEIDGFYWAVLNDRINHGYPIVHPNPRTLIKSGWESNDYFYDSQLSLSPNHCPSALRHLFVSGSISLYDSIIPNHWSTLTHIALVVAEVSLDFWFSFIRAVPDLQLGDFNIAALTEYDYTQPNKFTLPQLSTFSIAICGTYGESELEFPLGVLFTGLYLPALRDLSLSTKEAWSNHHALTHIYIVLNSTPAITTLTLGVSFLSLEDEKYFVQILPLISDIEPLWSRATHLVHLRLEAMDPLTRNQPEMEKIRDTLVRNIFHRDSRWLDLHNPACPIQAISILDRAQSKYLQAISIRNFTMSSVRKHAEEVPNVKAVLAVTAETKSQVIAAAWNEWGPNLETVNR